MRRGYLTAKCHRCGSTSKMVVGGIRSEFSLCPVCLEGELEFLALNIEIDPRHSLGKIKTRYAGESRFRLN